MKVEFKVYEDPGEGRPIGKMIVRPETPEELADLDEFRRRVGRHGGGDKFEVVFFPKTPRVHTPDQTEGEER